MAPYPAMVGNFISTYLTLVPPLCFSWLCAFVSEFVRRAPFWPALSSSGLSCSHHPSPCIHPFWCPFPHLTAGCYHHPPADTVESPPHQFGQTVSKDAFASLFQVYPTSSQQFVFFEEGLVVIRARVIPVTPAKEPVHILLDVPVPSQPFPSPAGSRRHNLGHNAFHLHPWCSNL